jgi:copper chaperone CopZ
VSIHCEGCKKKVKKVLHSIEGMVCYASQETARTILALQVSFSVPSSSEQSSVAVVFSPLTKSG